MDDLIQQSQILSSQSQWSNSLPASELTEPVSQVPSQSQDSQQTQEQKPWGMLAYVSSKLKNKPNIELTKSNYQFGKSYGENDFIFEEQDVGVLTHLTISRRHFQIELRDVGDRKLPYITDLSSNGTFVQGSLIGRNNCRILSHGDIISLSKKNQKFFVFYQLEFQNIAGIPEEVTRNYVIITAIGKGGFGCVYLTIKKDTSQEMAMKVIQSNANETTDPFIEPRLMYEVKHPNVVSIYSMLRIENNFYLFMEYMKGGDLARYLRERGHLKESVTKYIIYQAACGIAELHRLKIVHRDIKPLNILLDSNSEYPKVKITDFGLAKKMKNDMTRVHTLCGTRSFTAPELINTFIISKYDRRADIWSLGVVLYFCLSGRLPFVAKNGENVEWWIKQAHFQFEPLELWEKISPNAIELIKRMLSRSYLYRPFADSLMADNWFMKDPQFIQRIGLRKRKENFIRNNCCSPAKKSVPLG